MKALRILLALIILCLAITSASAYTITEFCADGYAKGDGDEYFILEGTGSLSAWSVTDGEGTVSFSSGSGRTVVARSAELYYQIHGSYPDFEITESLTSIPNAVVSGRFQLANSEDSLTLLENGRAVQTVAWPADVVKIKDDIVTIETGSDKTKLKVFKWAVRAVEIPAEEVEKPEKK